MRTNSIEEIIEILKNNEQFLVVGHMNPDADCVSSQCALADFLRYKGKKVILANAGPFNKSLFNSYQDWFISSIEPYHQDLKDKKTILLVVDCSTADRIGSLQKETEDFFTVVIDHHASGDDSFGNIRYIDSNSPSTTILIKRIISLWDPQSLNLFSEMLFWGFCTDSGFFRYLQGNSGSYLHDVADLVLAGANPSQMYARVMHGKSLLSRDFITTLVRKMKKLHNNRFFMATITRRMDNKYKDEKDTPAFYDLVMAIQGCEVIAVIKYISFRKYSVSLRSNRLDVGTLALKYGGGGHKLASGFPFSGSLRLLKKKLTNDVGQLLDPQKI